MKPIVLLMVSIFVLAVPSPGDTATAPRASCGGYRLITSIQGAGALAERTLAIYRARTLARLDSRGEIETACVDLSGDGRPELIIQTYTGGAHCCFEIFVYQLQPVFRRLLRFQAGNAGGFEVHHLNGRIVLELGDDSFAYFSDLCYACSPSRLPMAACYRDARFVDCTNQFPQLAPPFISAYTGRLKEAMRFTDDSRVDYMRGAALGLYAVYALVGKPGEGLAAVSRITKEATVLRWLQAQRAAVQQRLAKRGSYLKP
ncbi:MAG TPA: hypothetical protein VGK88_01055 [bacterium]